MSFKTPPDESNLKKEGIREWVPFFLYNEQETLYPAMHVHKGSSGVGYVEVKLCLDFNLSPRHEGILRSGGIAPCILDLATGWR
jgi:hypothetical protein